MKKNDFDEYQEWYQNNKEELFEKFMRRFKEIEKVWGIYVMEEWEKYRVLKEEVINEVRSE